MTAADRWTWIDIVRRARLPRTVKGIAYLLATYADNDGTRIFPGIATVAVAAGVDYKTAKRAIAELVKAGLLERVASRSGRRGAGDEYRLILAEDLQERIEVLTPAQFEVAAERFRDANRRSKRTPGTGNAVPRPDGEGQVPPAPVPDPPSNGGRGTGDPQFDEGRGTARPGDGGAPSAIHNHDLNTTTTSPIEEEVRTAATGPRASDSDQPLFSDEKFEDPTRLAQVRPIRRGLGFCIPCYADGKTVVADDPESGDACTFHLRQEAS